MAPRHRVAPIPSRFPGAYCAEAVTYDGWWHPIDFPSADTIAKPFRADALRGVVRDYVK